MNDYLQVAKNNEVVFRSILRDLRENRTQRPNGFYVPEDLETEIELESIFEKYSLGRRYGIFTITDFVVEDGIAIIRFEDIAFLSGGGAGLKYSVKGDVVEYLGQEYIVLS